MKKSDEKTAFRILGLENSQPQNGAPFFLFFLRGGVVRNLVKNHGVWEGKHYSLTHLPKKTMANLGSRWVVSHTYTWRQMASIAKPFGTHKRQSSHQTIASGFSWNQEDVHWNFHMLRPIPPKKPRCEKNPWTSSPSISHDFPMPLTGSPLFNQCRIPGTGIGRRNAPRVALDVIAGRHAWAAWYWTMPTSQVTEEPSAPMLAQAQMRHLVFKPKQEKKKQQKNHERRQFQMLKIAM